MKESHVQLSGLSITSKVDLTRTAKLSAERRLRCVDRPDSDRQPTSMRQPLSYCQRRPSRVTSPAFSSSE